MDVETYTYHAYVLKEILYGSSIKDFPSFKKTPIQRFTRSLSLDPQGGLQCVLQLLETWFVRFTWPGNLFPEGVKVRHKCKGLIYINEIYTRTIENDILLFSLSLIAPVGIFCENKLKWMS